MLNIWNIGSFFNLYSFNFYTVYRADPFTLQTSYAVVNINMQVSTPDVTGFQRSRTQIAAQMIRAMGRGRRNL